MLEPPAQLSLQCRGWALATDYLDFADNDLIHGLLEVLPSALHSQGKAAMYTPCDLSWEEDVKHLLVDASHCV